MHNRNWKKWRSLLKISREIDEKCLIDSLSIALRKTREFAEEPSLQIEILLRIRTVFREEKKDFLATTVILKALNMDKEAPWADWMNGTQKGLTSHRLGKVLREHFQVKSVRPGKNATTRRGYRSKDLEPYFNMLPPEDPPPSDGSGSAPTEPKGPDPSVSSPSYGVSGPKWSPNVSPSESGIKWDRLQAESSGSVQLEAVPLNILESTSSNRGPLGTALFTEGAVIIPPSISSADFCIPVHPERLLFLDYRDVLSLGRKLFTTARSPPPVI